MLNQIVRGDDGLWWVLKDGGKSVSFPTRSEARMYLGLPTITRTVNPGDLDAAYLHRLSPIEARIASLRLKGASQSEIALQVNVTQPTVAYHLRKASWRTGVFKRIPELDFHHLHKTLPALVGDADCDIFLDFLKLTSQSRVARKIGRSQGFVRHRLKKVMSSLEKSGEFTNCLQAAKVIFGNPAAFIHEPDGESGGTQSAGPPPSHPSV